MNIAEEIRLNIQRLAYITLDDCFQTHQNDVLEIEILPLAISPPDGIMLQDGLSLGVPKKILVLAFLEAREIFSRRSDLAAPASAALNATKVMLLLDPEHITAANFRKRKLLALRDNLDNQQPFREALQHELCFLNTVLTSPLHRQSKSPTLWHHRLWLLNLYTRHVLDRVESQEQSSSFWLAEFAAVRKSGQQHPKNYYAWQYARHLISRIGSVDIIEDIARTTKEWCCKHPSDISGWNFLFWLFSRPHCIRNEKSLIDDVVVYAINLGAVWESLWMFVRVVLVQRDRSDVYQTLQRYREDISRTYPKSQLLECIERTLNWVDAYGKPSKSKDIDVSFTGRDSV